MKRVLSIIMFSCLIPLIAWSMHPLPDSSLSGVTGQAGVSINPDVSMNISIGSAAWGDSSGLDSPWWDPSNSDSGGYVGVRNFAITNLRMKSRETDTFGGYDASQWKPITIDVATDPGMYGGSTFVRLGEGALQITWDSMRLEAVTGASGSSLDQKLGELYLGGLALYLNPVSYIDIYNGRSGSGVGVNLAWYTLADRIDLSAVSWGDSDGLPGGLNGDAVTWMAPGGSPGYVGLSNVRIGASGLIGTFAIDVNTSTSGTYADMNGSPVSVVHISFPTDFLIYTDRFNAEVRTDNTPQLASPNAGILGDLFIDTLNITIMNGSWVDIWAH